MAKPKDLVFGVDHLEPNVLTEAEVAKIRALYNIRESVKMRIPGSLESVSNSNGEVVFFTDVFKHRLRLPLRHSCDEGEERQSGGVGAVELSVGGAEGALRSRGADLAENLTSASGVGVRSLGIGVGSDCGEAYPHFIPDMSLKRLIATKREIEVIERVQSRIPEEALLDYKNLFRAVAGGRAMTEATRRRLESRAPEKKKIDSSRPKTKPPRQVEGASGQKGTPGDRRREVIEGALDVTTLPKRPRGPNEEPVVLVSDEEDAEAEPVNIACPRKVVPFVNCFIDGAQMELPELEQLPKKSVREQAGRAFCLQAAISVLTVVLSKG
ncbi:unnamed protein product [Prunus armeniaca]